MRLLFCYCAYFWAGLIILNPKETKFENASELYEKAGIAYKTGKCWNDAGDAYTRMSECCAQLGQQGDKAARLKEVCSPKRPAGSDLIYFFLYLFARFVYNPQPPPWLPPLRHGGG